MLGFSANFCFSLLKRNLFGSTRYSQHPPRYYSSAYEPDGRTVVKILNMEYDLGILINAYGQFGFRLNNEIVVLGPMAIFPRSVLSWNVSGVEDITEESLSLFHTIEPKIDILVIGIGDTKVTPDLSERIFNLTRKYQITVEILSTDQACSTFNFLNSEARMVAAAILPPHHLHHNENDMLQTRLKRKNLYRTDDYM